MKINNKNRLLYCNITIINLLIIFVTLISLWVCTEIYYTNYNALQQILLCSCIIVLFIFNFLQRHIFQYENNDKVLIFKNENLLKFLETRTDKISKTQLIDFEIKQNGISKILYIKQNRKDNILLYNIDFLSDTELQNLTEDLKNVILKNCFHQQKHFIAIA